MKPRHLHEYFLCNQKHMSESYKPSFCGCSLIRNAIRFSNKNHRIIVTIITVCYTFSANWQKMDKKIEQKLDSFFTKFKPLYYGRGEILLRPDDLPSGIFFLNRGYVRDYTISDTGEELTLIIFKPGDIFPLPWAINKEEIIRYLEAMTPIQVWRSPREKFLDFLKSEPDVLLALTGRVMVRLSGLMERMKYLVFGNAYTKVISILLICAERFGQKKNGFIEIRVPLTHKDIALLVGINRETASRQLEKLASQGLISYVGKLLIVNEVEKLKEEVAAHGIKRKRR